MIQDYISSMCEIKNMDNEMLAIGVLTDADGKHIEISTKAAAMPILDFGTKVKVNVYNFKQGLCVLTGKVYTSAEHFMSITDLEFLAAGERRKFFRVEVSMPRQIQCLPEQGLPTLSPVDVEIIDLSLSGFGFRTEYAVDPERRYAFMLPLARKDCEAKFRIVRIDELSDGTYRYGCEFDEMSTADTDSLCAFIFGHQREQIRKRREGEEL